MQGLWLSFQWVSVSHRYGAPVCRHVTVTGSLARHVTRSLARHVTWSLARCLSYIYAQMLRGGYHRVDIGRLTVMLHLPSCTRPNDIQKRSNARPGGLEIRNVALFAASTFLASVSATLLLKILHMSRIFNLDTRVCSRAMLPLQMCALTFN